MYLYEDYAVGKSEKNCYKFITMEDISNMLKLHYQVSGIKSCLIALKFWFKGHPSFSINHNCYFKMTVVNLMYVL